MDSTAEMYNRACRQLQVLGWAKRWMDRSDQTATHVDISNAIGPEVGAEWMCDAVDVIAQVVALFGVPIDTLAGRIFIRHTVAGCEGCTTCSYFQAIVARHSAEG